MDKRVVLVLLLCMCSILIFAMSAFGIFTAKKSGVIEGTEEYYIQKYELDKLKKILVDAMVADTTIVTEEKTVGDFLDIDDFIEYKIQFAATETQRNETIARSQPHIDRIKRWCAKHYDAVDTFKKSTTIKINYLDGTQISAKKFYDRYMNGVSDEAKALLLKICGK